MRRWVLIILLLIYPFQVTLAMADGCCVMTAAGVSHHVSGQESKPGTAAPVFLADDAPSTAVDPHCPACVFGHISGFPSHTAVPPAVVYQAAATGSATPSPSSIPRSRPERPNWRAAAR